MTMVLQSWGLWVLESPPHSDCGGFPIFEGPLRLTEQGVVACILTLLGLIRFQQHSFSDSELMRLGRLNVGLELV